ncbi:hypothetical protein ACFQ8C_34435 [Streptomyces sp. NPDC056503]|uniref:hypothetical protein n=1 Tax=Streptomyces sp. NPDC056503 TaxID=3345842 RepID=UPI0036BF2F87
MTQMDNISVTSHLKVDTRTRVTAFPGRARPFVSLRIEGDAVEIALLCSLGSADALRTLATAASEAAATLDALTADAAEGVGHE